ncbi:MAG: hypothetical protein Q7S03_03740 [bacterium]|nr:hypothetical protein [bacterium]
MSFLFKIWPAFCIGLAVFVSVGLVLLFLSPLSPLPERGNGRFEVLPMIIGIFCYLDFIVVFCGGLVLINIGLERQRYLS